MTHCVTNAKMVPGGCGQDCCGGDDVLAMVQVIVLEKGGFTPAAELALTEQEGFSTMYEMASLLTTQDAGAGRCLHDCCPVWLILWLFMTPAWLLTTLGPENTTTEPELPPSLYLLIMPYLTPRPLRSLFEDGCSRANDPGVQQLSASGSSTSSGTTHPESLPGSCG